MVPPCDAFALLPYSMLTTISRSGTCLALKGRPMLSLCSAPKQFLNLYFKGRPCEAPDSFARQRGREWLTMTAQLLRS